MTAPKKNRAAQALGRRGGKANTPAQLAARQRLMRQMGGRPPVYRVIDDQAGSVLKLQHREGEDWNTVRYFSPRALAYVATWMKAHKPTMAVLTIEDGDIDYTFNAERERK